VVGDDDVGTRTADAGEGFEDGRALVEQPGGGGGLDHRVLPTHVVRGHGHVGALLDAPDDVEVGQRGLDHQDVGPLRGVERGLADRFGGIGRIHLVAPAVPRLGRAVGSVAERAVEGGGVLGRVGHDRQLGLPRLVEGAAQGADSAVHHVAGSQRVGAGGGLGDGDPGEQLERLVVVDHSVGPQHAAVAVARVLAQAQIGDDRQSGVGRLDRPGGELDDALVVPGLRAHLVLGRREPEEHHSPDAQRGRLGGLLHRVVDGEVIDPGHGRDRRTTGRSADHEHRVDQVARREGRLAHERAQRVRLSQSSEPGLRKRHRDDRV
jgi:hypothetical protein